MSWIVKRIVAWWVIPALMVACTSQPTVPPRPETPIGMSLVDLLGRIKAGQVVVDALPPPERVVTTELPNRDEPGKIDTIRTLIYPGLTLTVVQRADSSEPKVAQVAVTSGDYQTQEGLHVGSSLQALSDAFGEADRLEGDEYVYMSESPKRVVTQFRVEDQRIAHMQWTFHLE